MAIYTLLAAVSAVNSLFGYLELWKLESRGQRLPLETFGYVVVLLGIAWFLWFRPEVFAGRASSEPRTVPTAVEFRRALFAAVGLFFLVQGALSIVTDLWYQMIEPVPFASVDRMRWDLVNGASRGILGGLVLLLNIRPPSESSLPPGGPDASET